MPDTHVIAAPADYLTDLGARQPSLRPLLDAGCTLAKLAEPIADTLDAAGRLGELQLSLQSIQTGLDRVFDLDPSPEEEAVALRDAARASGRVLVSLVELIGAIEARVADHERRQAA